MTLLNLLIHNDGGRQELPCYARRNAELRGTARTIWSHFSVGLELDAKNLLRFCFAHFIVAGVSHCCAVDKMPSTERYTQ